MIDVSTDLGEFFGELPSDESDEVGVDEADMMS